MVEINASNSTDLRVIECRCTVNTSVVAHIGSNPVGCKCEEAQKEIVPRNKKIRKEIKWDEYVSFFISH
ncbi:hypothetical protein Lal_00016431 [Lupinus albus]|nr:hypothetical protein Lal_00016431 [Lupinus albus]